MWIKIWLDEYIIEDGIINHVGKKDYKSYIIFVNQYKASIVAIKKYYAVKKELVLCIHGTWNSCEKAMKRYLGEKIQEF